MKAEKKQKNLGAIIAFSIAAVFFVSSIIAFFVILTPRSYSSLFKGKEICKIMRYEDIGDMNSSEFVFKVVRKGDSYFDAAVSRINEAKYQKKGTGGRLDVMIVVYFTDNTKLLDGSYCIELLDAENNVTKRINTGVHFIFEFKGLEIPEMFEVETSIPAYKIGDFKAMLDYKSWVGNSSD